MEENTYIEKALRTDIQDYTTVARRYLAHSGMLNIALIDAVKQADRLDKLKKFLFYGKETEEFYYDSEYVAVDEDLERLVAEECIPLIRLLHAQIGSITESAELISAILPALECEEIDVTNVKEELGDKQWYAALEASCIPDYGTTLTEVRNKNIAKLKARYPEKFTELKAIERDLDAEKLVLES